MYKKILLAYDGSDAGQQALLDCKEIAQMEQSELHLLAVVSFSFNGAMGVDIPIKCPTSGCVRQIGVLD